MFAVEMKTDCISCGKNANISVSFELLPNNFRLCLYCAEELGKKLTEEVDQIKKRIKKEGK